MSVMEKLNSPPGSLPEPILNRLSPSKSALAKTALVTLLALGLLAKGIYTISCHHSSSHSLYDTSVDICPQVSELIPQRDHALWETLGSIYGTESFKLKAADWLSEAVQVP